MRDSRQNMERMRINGSDLMMSMKSRILKLSIDFRPVFLYDRQRGSHSNGFPINLTSGIRSTLS